MPHSSKGMFNIRNIVRWLKKQLKKLDLGLIITFSPLMFFIIFAILMLIGILKLHLEF